MGIKDVLKLTIHDLPRRDPELRWTKFWRRKLWLCIEAGVITLPEARVRYELSIEEFLDWREEFTRGGRRRKRVGATVNRPTDRPTRSV